MSSPVGLIARRFLTGKNRQSFVSFIAVVSILGVALGVTSLTVVTSVINGFRSELSRVITGMNGEVILYSRAEPVERTLELEQRIQHALADSFLALTSSFVVPLMVVGPDGVAGAVLEGVDWNTVQSVTQVKTNLSKGQIPLVSGEVALGSSLAERLGAELGTSIKIVSPSVGDEPPRVLNAKVVGIIRMGMHDYDSKFVYTSLLQAQNYLEQKNKITTFKIKLSPGANARSASDRLTDNFGYPFRAKDWGQLNKNLFYAIELEKAVIAVILTVIIIVAAFNVISTLMMMIHDKSKEIAILKAMGFPAPHSFRLFIWLGLGIGLVGTGGGLLGGLGLSSLIAKTKFIELPSEIYYLSFLPVEVRWIEIAGICTVALGVTLIAALIPAYQVATRSPLEGIRYD